MNITKKIEQWVVDRNINTGDPRVQICKTMEELGELAAALSKNKKEEAKDAIGDVVVTLIAIAMQLNLEFDECVEFAYNQIKDRKGKLVNGIFVKEQDL